MPVSQFALVDEAPSAGRNVDVLSVEWLRNAAETVETGHRSRVADQIARAFPTLDSAELRNAAALALADMGYPHIQPVLNHALERSENALTGGTLLFALDEAGACVTHETVRTIAEYGSYEARAELLVLLRKGRLAPTTADDLLRTRETLSAAASGEEPDAAEAAELALDLISDL